jgi:hypothetical protein
MVYLIPGQFPQFQQDLVGIEDLVVFVLLGDHKIKIKKERG